VHENYHVHGIVAQRLQLGAPYFVESRSELAVKEAEHFRGGGRGGLA